MLKFAVITNEKISTQTCTRSAFESFLEEVVGINFGHRQLEESVIIEDNILGELNLLATKLFNKNLYGTVVFINRENDEYISITDKQLEVLYENT